MVKDAVISARRQELQEALIAAATRTVAKSGYAALRARDVAAEVGCAVGAIYNVFPDLDALILAVKSRTLDELQRDVLERLGEDVSRTPAQGRQRLLAAAGVYIDFAQRHRRLWMSAFEHSSPETPALDAYMVRLDAIFGNVEQPLAALLPNMAATPRKQLARALFAAVHGMVQLGLDQKLGAVSPQSLRWQVDLVLGAALDGLAAGPGPEPAPEAEA